MSIPERFRKDSAALPPPLRALLEAELAAGNEIVAVHHGHPAPPIGACVQLARPIGTRARASGDGLAFRAVTNVFYAGYFTDANESFFILEPPPPPAPEPDMDAIRAAVNTPRPPPRRDITPETPYLIELDHKGEMLTYREQDRKADVMCSVYRTAILEPRTLSDWWYPHERRSQPMTPAEKELVLRRLVDYVHVDQDVARVELEDWPELGRTFVSHPRR